MRSSPPHLRLTRAAIARRALTALRAIAILSLLASPLAAAGAVPVSSTLKIYGRNKVPTKVTATISPSDHNRGSSPNKGANQLSRRVGCAEDQAGHAVPKVLGGPGRIGNIYPLLGKTNNALGKWEQKLGKRLKDGECLTIDYEVRLRYGDAKLKLRPTDIEIDAVCHRPDGVAEKITTKRVHNDKPSKCATKVFPED